MPLTRPASSAETTVVAIVAFPSKLKTFSIPPMFKDTKKSLGIIGRTRRMKKSRSKLYCHLAVI